MSTLRISDAPLLPNVNGTEKIPTGGRGDYAVSIDQIKNFTQGGLPQQVEDHINDTNNPHQVTKEQVGLGNVDNTSDLNKPISTATQTALGLKADKLTTYTKIEVDGSLSTKADKSYVDSQDLLKADKTYVDNALSSLNTQASKFYPTLAEANADITDIEVNQPVQIGESGTNGGLWYKAVAEATTLTKSAYDPLTQAKNYTEDYTNLKIRLDVFGETIVETIPYTPIVGAAANTDPSQSSPIGGSSPDRSYIKIDVSKYTKLLITGSVNRATWPWVLVDTAGVKTVTSVYGDSALDIPSDVIWAYRTVKTELYTENLDMLLEGVIWTENSIQKQIDDVKEAVFGDNAVIVNYPIITGYAASDNLSQPSPIAAGAGREYTFVDVRNIKQLIISGSINRLTWVWVFIHEDGRKSAPSSYYGDGTFDVPADAVTAYRTLNTGAGVVENLDMTITAISKASIQKQIDNLSDVLESYGEKELVENPLIKSMQTDFDAGVMLKISDFGGATQHDQIENAIKFIKKRGRGILDMESGVWLRNSAILLPDNCWIYLNEATIKLANGVFDNVMRNEGIVPDPDPFKVAVALNENTNIRVFGKSNVLAAVEGPDVPYTAPHPINGGEPVRWVGDFYGWRTVPILIANTKNYKLHDFAMNKTTCWAISQEHGCENFEVFNIKFNTTVKNGDGVDVRQGCKKGKIYNISGSTADDMIALSALRKSGRVYPDGNYIYPMQVGGYADRGFGDDITDIQIANISGKGQHHGVRLLASGGSKVGNISVDNVSDNGGSFVNPIVLVSSGYGTPASMGDLFNITVNGIESHQSQTPLRLSGPIKDSSFNKIRQHKQTGVLYDNAATFENAEITNAEFVA